MKYFLLAAIFLSAVFLSRTARLGLRTPSAKKEEDTISDKELDEILKDPKYASIAGDLYAGPGSGKEGSKKTKSSDSTANGSSAASTDATSTSSDKGHYMSQSYKDHLKRMKKDGSMESDPLKELDSLGDVGSQAKEEDKKDKKKTIEDKFKSFDFLTKQQARYLIEILKQPVFFNMLPSEAKTIVHATNDNFSFKNADSDRINDFIDSSLLNSPNSMTYVDPEGVIGRKGVLTIINPETGDSKFVWAVSNARVLCFFQSQSLMTIVKLYRNSSLAVKDVNSTPCFLLSSMREAKDGSIMVCSTSTQEKEVWVQTIRSNLIGKE